MTVILCPSSNTKTNSGKTHARFFTGPAREEFANCADVWVGSCEAHSDAYLGGDRSVCKNRVTPVETENDPVDVLPPKLPTSSPQPQPAAYTLPSISSGTWNCDGLGYDCPSASNAFGGGGDSGNALSHAYACLDWSVGSNLWENQQCKYEQRTGETSPIFAVGTFGNSEARLGQCYR